MTANCNNPKCTASKRFMSSGKAVNDQFDINLRFIYALRSISSGFEDVKMPCTILDVPGPPTKFMKYNNIIAPAIQKVANECMVEAAQESAEKTGSTDLSVAVFGTGRRRVFAR